MDDEPTPEFGPDPRGLPPAALARLLRRASFGAGRALEVFRALHAEGAPATEGLPPDLLRWLRHNAPTIDVRIAETVPSTDGHTRKLLVDAGADRVETVVMRYRDRATACLSTQAGCAMGCVFCATGQGGFRRHLAAGEIVAQVHLARTVARELGVELRNLVLMGMGEPLHNYDEVALALETVTDPRGVGLAPRHVAISTVGHVPGIRRLVAERRPWNLAVSLHGSTDEERNALVPMGRRWPLAELLDACREHIAMRRRRLMVEWTLVAGRNDGADSAERLGRLLAGMDVHVNLIPLNPTAGYAGSASSPATIDAFRAILARHGLPSTVRQRRGIDRDAGCGQLAGRPRRPRETPPVPIPS